VDNLTSQERRAISQADIDTFALGYVRRFGHDAPARADEWAQGMLEGGDTEGAEVWRRVGETARTILAEKDGTLL